MKNPIVFSLLFLFVSTILFQNGQAQVPFEIEIVQKTIPNAPALHSFAKAQYNGKWLLIGGRLDGLHMRRPFEAFLVSDNNTAAYVIDPISGQVWSRSLSSLSPSLFEQLQSTNMEFIERDSILYIVGGYGYSNSQAEHITYPYLSAIDVPGLVNAIINNDPISAYFRQINDPNLAITGGYLGLIDSVFYLVGGQLFEGAYNPMGPTHGPGFVQEYSNEIRTFQIDDDGINLSISNYSAIRDTSNLHKRDFNMVAQIFPNGQFGYTAFSGVFQYVANLPWLNIVDIVPGTYSVNPSFSQFLSQYHSAHIPIYSNSSNEMHSLFFGGMSWYTLDTLTGTLVADPEVPFVNTISRVTRVSSGVVSEYKMPVEMPGLLGSGAEIFFLPSAPTYANGILDLDAVPFGRVLIGHIFGGIESSAPNIFFVNTGVESNAHNLAYEVYINKSATARDYQVHSSPLKMKVFPNPANDRMTIEIESKLSGKAEVKVIDLNGSFVGYIHKTRITPGSHTFIWKTDKLAPGLYFLTLETDGFFLTEKVEIKH